MNNKIPILKSAVVVILLGLLIFFSEWGAIKTLRSFTVASIKPLMRMTARLNAFARSHSFLSAKTGVEDQEIRMKALEYELQKINAENERLKNALDFKEQSRIEMLGANVLLYSVELGKEFLVLDQGEEKGVRQGNVVLDAHGVLVGTVAETGNMFSKVSIASNPDETLEVEIVPRGTRALAKGLGMRTLSLELIPQNTLLARGDLVAFIRKKSKEEKPAEERTRTSVLLGEIVDETPQNSAAFKQVYASLIIRPETLHEVFIITR